MEKKVCMAHWIPYNSYGEQTVKAETENVSTIIDRMIRATAKITEHYAGDIVYEIEALTKSIAKKEPLRRILVFREDGVTSYDVNGEANQFEWDSRYESGIQRWRLESMPSKNGPCTVFERIVIIKEN